MKRYLWAVFAFFAMVMSACSDDEPNAKPNVEPQEQDVVFVIETPEITTRAGEGELATKLYAAVYSEDWTEEFSNIRVEGNIDLQTSPHVSFRLVVGKCYNIVFWTMAENAPYTLNYAQKRMELNLEQLLSNNERNDAFFHVERSYVVSGTSSKNVVLKRPFAQLNIATKDWAEAVAAGANITKSSLTIDAHKWLSFVDGKVSSELQKVTYAMNLLPEESLTVNGETYTYLSLNYLLAGDKELLDCRFSTDGATPIVREWENIPLQRNYRTNILGNILSSENNSGVSIDSDFIDDMVVTSCNR